MMRGLAIWACFALFAAACAAPQPGDAPSKPASAPAAPQQKPEAKQRPALDEVQQIAPANGDAANIQQSAEGRDLCEPGVSEARRKAAGVDCDAKIKVDNQPVRSSATRDPLLEPSRQDVKEDFESLDLGDDVPATVILQR